MRSPKTLFMGSMILDIVLILYLITLADDIGLGIVLLLSGLLLGGSFITYILMNRS